MDSSLKTKTSIYELYPELLEEGLALDERSHEFKELDETVKDLAIAQGLGWVSLADMRRTTEVVDLPTGFIDRTLSLDGLKLDVDQFARKHVKLSPATQDRGQLDLPSELLKTDAGSKIRVCDLRGFASAKLQKMSPDTEAEQSRLDYAFYRDLKSFAETGWHDKTVKINTNILYSGAGSSKLRTYWMVVSPVESDGIVTVARLASHGDGDDIQKRAHHLLFEDSR